MTQLHFGVSLPQIKRTWAQTRAAAEELDRLGFDSVWLNDHLYGVPGPHIPILEAWTTLSAVASITAKVELGTLVTPIGFRNPAVLAKMIATLDNISDGRVIAGLGSGWFQMEYEGYGIEFPPVGQRLQQLDEAIRLMKQMWTQPQSTFEGKYFDTSNVFCEPKPVRQPHPPILIGGGGEKVLLRLAARHADIWNNLAVDQSALAAKIEVLKKHCDEVKRDFAEIRVSQQCLVVIGENEADAKAKLERAATIYGGHMGAGGPQSISGTAEQCLERIQQHVDLGCTMFVMELFGKDIREPAQLFAEQVIAPLRPQ
ncbi:MAG TPA: TIGR03560 family F420-dependent LLM class oxidoreductase [Terriglobales bacterium]|nr:TIGR03560 family F420-dependent LLM class oxidoreductase [Terriglobales bacterium]